MKKVSTLTRDGQNQKTPKEPIDIETDKPEHYDKEIYRNKYK